MNNTNAAPSSWERFKQSDFLYYFLKDKVAMFSFTVFMLFLVMALAAPIIAPSDPYDLSSIDIMDSELPPSWMEDGDERFLLGTDEQSRDIFSPFCTVLACR
jgi:peptide/nickel transport system permease protein